MPAESPLAGLTLAVIGAGNMGEVLLSGFLRQRLLPPERIVATAPRAERRAELAARHGVQTTADNRLAASSADILILAVKPQILPAVLPDLRGALPAHALVLSVLAGTTLTTLRRGLGHEAVVRSIPNTPSQIGAGMTVWSASPAVTEVQLAHTAALLGALGKERRVEQEIQVDMAAALSGTAPAFSFLVLEAMVDAGVHLGFSRPVAKELVLQGVHGSLLLALQSGEGLTELRGKVTSPGGVSADALYILEKGGLRTVLADGIWAGYRRILELGEETPVERRGPDGK